MIGIGVIGAGYWGPKHVRNFRELPEARVVMVADLDERRLLAAFRHNWDAVFTTGPALMYPKWQPDFQFI
jgi:predicted dehydrogenase